MNLIDRLDAWVSASPWRDFECRELRQGYRFVLIEWPDKRFSETRTSLIDAMDEALTKAERDGQVVQ